MKSWIKLENGKGDKIEGLKKYRNRKKGNKKSKEEIPMVSAVISWKEKSDRMWVQ